jgi:hypothetical protein
MPNHESIQRVGKVHSYHIYNNKESSALRAHDLASLFRMLFSLISLSAACIYVSICASGVFFTYRLAGLFQMHLSVCYVSTRPAGGMNKGTVHIKKRAVPAKDVNIEMSMQQKYNYCLEASVLLQAYKAQVSERLFVCCT